MRRFSAYEGMKSQTANAKSITNATGPFTDAIRKMDNQNQVSFPLIIFLSNAMGLHYPRIFCFRGPYILIWLRNCDYRCGVWFQLIFAPQKVTRFIVHIFCVKRWSEGLNLDFQVEFSNQNLFRYIFFLLRMLN